MIWLVWAMHHDLFEKAEVITRKTFLVNGIWLFLLTIVPFTTAWVGSAPYSFLPEFLYPLNLLLWSAAFQLLDYEIRRDNPEMPKDVSSNRRARFFLYIVCFACMILAFLQPVFSIRLVGISTLIMFVRFFLPGKKTA